MRKRWLFIPLAVALLALVITSGAILAQGNKHPSGDGPVNGLVSRVAEILGLQEDTVQNAFNQAFREQQDQRMQAMLDRMVEAQRITSDDAKAIEDWYRSRPDAAVQTPGVWTNGARTFRAERLKRSFRWLPPQ